MKRFILKIAIVPLIILALVITIAMVSSAIVKNRQFRNWETESNTLIMKENRHYDLGMLGISHARNFSRHNNHQKVEEILGKSLLNLGQGSGRCGVNEQLFYLDYAYSEGVTLDTLIYVMSPPMVCGDYLNKSSATFDREAFSWSFFNRYLDFEADNKRERLFSYVKSKLHPDWIFSRPYAQESMSFALDTINDSIVKGGFESAYKDTNLMMSFEKNIGIIKKTLSLAQEHDTEIILFIPPALFGEWPYHDEVWKFMKDMKSEFGAQIYDFNGSMRDPKDYYDHHHLNTEGVLGFVEKELMLIMN